VNQLSPAYLNDLLDPWLAGRTVERAELMPGGLMNRNYHLRLRGRPADAVLRFYDRDASACARELAVLGLLGRDVPVPRVLYVDDERGHEPPLAILSMVDGISLFTLRALGDGDALAEAAFDAGRVLATIRQYPGPPTPRTTVLERVERSAAAPAFEDRAGTDVRRGIVSAAERWQPWLDALPIDRSLVHGDFNSRNIFVRQTDEGWRVSGVLDWEFATQGGPFADIGSFLRYHDPDRPRYEPHFSAGLRAGGMTLPPDWLAVARIMDLPALCELLARPGLSDEMVRELLAVINRLPTNPPDR
jgi:aminoglycoside phosphotransferase (APT) family kinase protein